MRIIGIRIVYGICSWRFLFCSFFRKESVKQTRLFSNEIICAIILGEKENRRRASYEVNTSNSPDVVINQGAVMTENQNVNTATMTF